ncbi:DUF2057 family protein [Ferrimonas pelagia]
MPRGLEMKSISGETMSNRAGEAQLENEQVVLLRYRTQLMENDGDSFFSSPGWIVPISVTEGKNYELILNEPNHANEWYGFVRDPKCYLLAEDGERIDLELRTTEQWMARLLLK